MKLVPALLFVALAALATGARAAAKVELAFLPPEKYADVGEGPIERERNLKELGDYFQKIAEKRLADGQTLMIGFQDIDLAGRPKLFHRSGGDYRIMTGQADWPRIKLRWVLQTPGAPDRSGDELIADMNYLWRVPSWRVNETLYYEKRMIDEWFKKTFPADAANLAGAPASAALP